jgi:cytoskeletal protein RodZ
MGLSPGGREASVGEFGEKFRKERERRGLTLDDVSNVTKINSRMLKAIETEHFDQLPGGVFNKGFVRAYAKHLGFNDEEAITEYLTVLREAQIGAQTAEWQPGHKPETRAGIEQRSEMPPPKSPSVEREPVERRPVKLETKSVAVKATHVEPRVLAVPQAGKHQAPIFHSEPAASNERTGGAPWKIPVIVLAILVAGGALWTRHSRNARAQQTSSPRQNIVQTADSGGQANPTPRDPKAGATAVSAALSPHASSAASPSSSPVAASATAATKQSKVPEDSDVTVRAVVNKPPAATATNAPATFTLVIRATENSWISVLADGQLVSQETLIAPAHTSARASREIVVKAGNAAGVSFLLNGKEIAPQGDEGEVRTYVFDSTGMRTSAPGQAQ